MVLPAARFPTNAALSHNKLAKRGIPVSYREDERATLNLLVTLPLGATSPDHRRECVRAPSSPVCDLVGRPRGTTRRRNSVTRNGVTHISGEV